MGKLTAKDSLNIIEAVDYLNNAGPMQADAWWKSWSSQLDSTKRDAILKELSKGPHKGMFNKPIETEQDSVPSLVNNIKSKQGIMSTYAPADRYKEAKMNFDNSVTNMNLIALQLQVAQDEYDSLASAFTEEEKSMQILVEDKYKDYPPALLTLGLGRKDAFSRVALENPELHKSLKEKKQQMIELDSQLGFKMHGDIGAGNKFEKRALGMPSEEKNLFVQYKEAKQNMFKMLKTLNIFEGDSAKTILPQEFLESSGYNTLSLEEE